jgi:hypothetical protein
MSEELANSVDSGPESAASVASPEPQAASQGSAAESQGFDSPFSAFRHLPEFAGADDLAIAQDLYRSKQGYLESQRVLGQYQNLIPQANEYLRNKAEYERWQASQREAAQPKPAEKAKWWSPPSVDESYKGYIVRDPQTGKEVIDPNAPYEAQQALRKYQDYTANFARKFVTDPENTLKPFIEDVAMQKAKELVEQHLGQYQSQNYVQDLERQNSDWLYDESGNVTREGQAVQAYIQQAAEYGIQTPEARWKFATGMLQRDLLNVRYQQMQAAPAYAPQQAPAYAPAPQQAPAYAPAPPPADPVAEQNMQFLRERATRTPNRSAGTTEPRAPRQRMSFEERLRGQLVNDGVI